MHGSNSSQMGLETCLYNAAPWCWQVCSRMTFHCPALLRAATRYKTLTSSMSNSKVLSMSPWFFRTKSRALRPCDQQACCQPSEQLGHLRLPFALLSVVSRSGYKSRHRRPTHKNLEAVWGHRKANRFVQIELAKSNSDLAVQVKMQCPQNLATGQAYRKGGRLRATLVKIIVRVSQLHRHHYASNATWLHAGYCLLKCWNHPDVQ